MLTATITALRAARRPATAACGLALLAAAAGPAAAEPAEAAPPEARPIAADLKVGGRIQLEFAVPVDDDDLPLGAAGVYFRRVRLNVTGKVAGWDYKFENEFADAMQPSFRDAYIAHKLGPGKLTLGQFKAQRGMEELTSANELTLLERPVTSAAGMFSGRQFGLGAMYGAHAGDWTAALAYQSLGQVDGGVQTPTESTGINGRVTFAPVHAERSVVHFGLSASTEKQEDDLDVDGDTVGDPRLRARLRVPAGRRGVSTTLAQAGEGMRAHHAGVEFGAVVGSGYVQAEAIQGWFEDSTTNGGQDDTVFAYQVTGSFIVTGESKPYDSHKGVFRSPKPGPESGAVELAARYESASADEAPVEGYTATGGVNWYFSQTMRFMANFSTGEIEVAGVASKASLFTVRAQIVF